MTATAKPLPNFNDYLNALFFCPANYGAAGDGETDDTEAIQDAIDACSNNGGGIVFLQPGQYVQSDDILVPRHVQLVGPMMFLPMGEFWQDRGKGAVILNDENDVAIRTRGNCAIVGINFEGSGTGGFVSIESNSTRIENCCFFGKEHALVNDCTVDGYYNSRIVGNTMVNQTGHGIRFTNPNGVRQVSVIIEDNWIRKDSVTTGGGIYVEGVGLEDSVVCNNTFDNIVDAGSYCIYLVSNVSCQVTGNQIETAGKSSNGLFLYNSAYIDVHANSFIGVDKGVVTEGCAACVFGPNAYSTYNHGLYLDAGSLCNRILEGSAFVSGTVHATNIVENLTTASLTLGGTLIAGDVRVPAATSLPGSPAAGSLAIDTDASTHGSLMAYSDGAWRKVCDLP